VTNVTFSFETSPNKTLREKCGGTWHIMSPPSEKAGGRAWVAKPFLKWGAQVHAKKV